MSKIQNIYDNDVFFKNYVSLRESNGGFNDLIEEPAMHSLLPVLKGKTVLDIGCGFGGLSRYVVEQGAKTALGIDPSQNMLEAAEKLTTDPRITYQQIAVEDFDVVENTYDLIVSSVAFHYVADFYLLLTKIAGWLKPQGHLIFSVEHPICTAYPEALLMTDDQGRQFHPVYNYRDEKAFEQTWFIEGVQKNHRQVSTYVNALIDAGLRVEKVLEPMPSDALLAQEARFSAHKIRPPLLMCKAVKG